MLLFSTVLFIDGHPVAYHVYHQKGRLILQPDDIIKTNIKVPVLTAVKKENLWMVTGTEDENLVEQVLEDIKNNEQKFSF